MGGQKEGSPEVSGWRLGGERWTARQALKAEGPVGQKPGRGDGAAHRALSSIGPARPGLALLASVPPGLGPCGRSPGS